MVVTLEEGVHFRFSVTRRRFPRRMIYRNVEMFLGSELAAYTGQDNGRIYRNPEVRLNRILLTSNIRDQLRIQVIFTKQKIVNKVNNFWTPHPPVLSILNITSSNFLIYVFFTPPTPPFSLLSMISNVTLLLFLMTRRDTAFLETERTWCPHTLLS